MRTSIQVVIISILLVLAIKPAMSQELDTVQIQSESKSIRYPNLIKVNTFGLVFSNLSLVYERGIMPRLSASMGIGYKYSGAEPKLFSLNDSQIEAGLSQIKGLSITPSARYYLRTCDPGKLEGFYTGLYLRYTGYKTAAGFDYQPDNGGPKELYSTDIKMKEYGVGIQFGYQMIIKERFSIDFMFFGPRLSSYHMKYNFNQPPTQEFLNDLSDNFNEIIDRLGFDYNVDIKPEGETSASSSFLFANMRVGLSLGFAF